MLLGAESLAGYAAIYTRTVALPDLFASDSTLPVSLGKWERSAVTAPIMCESKVAGSLIVSSVLVGYFSSEQILLVQDYADLLALAFESADFYNPQNVRLRLLPAQDEQQPAIRSLRKRANELMRAERSLSVSQAEQQAWQQIEEELLQLQLTKETTKE